MQPACRDARQARWGAGGRRRICVKAVLLNVLLDGAWYQAGDRLMRLSRAADRR
jgi:hypothetical protein